MWPMNQLYHHQDPEKWGAWEEEGAVKGGEVPGKPDPTTELLCDFWLWALPPEAVWLSGKKVWVECLSLIGSPSELPYLGVLTYLTRLTGE